MTLPIPAAKAILRQRLGAPVKDVKYVYGFRTATGRVLALHPEQQETRLWYQPPEAPNLPGVRRHVAVILEPARNRNVVRVPETPPLAVVHHAGLGRIVAGEQRGARRVAERVLRGGMVEPHAALRERVDVGRLDPLDAVATKLRSQIVGDDEEDVGFARGRGDRGKGGRRHQQRSREQAGWGQHGRTLNP